MSAALRARVTGTRPLLVGGVLYAGAVLVLLALSLRAAWRGVRRSAA